MAETEQTRTINYQIKTITNVSDIQNAAAALTNGFAKVKAPEDLQERFNKAFKGLEKDITGFQSKVNALAKGSGTSQTVDIARDKMVESWKAVLAIMKKVNTEKIHFDISPESLKQIKTIENQIAELQTKIKNIGASFDFSGGIISLKKVTKSSAVDDLQKSIGTGNIEEASKAMERLVANKDAFTNPENLAAYTTALAPVLEMFNSFKSKVGEADQAVQKLGNEKLGVLNDEQAKSKQNFLDLATYADSATNSISKCAIELTASAEAQQRVARESDQLKSRITTFFGMTNAVMLFRSALNKTISTVKSLDKAMTETAVVTNYSVSDMWDKLPTYTKTANQLGATIQGTYETMTLFYQQGLKTNEVFEVGTETMKMAKIAGLDYSEATDRMTAALRGFNMEINETSAKNVADVYSQLAAKTAADVDEISSAMTKTASIAKSANMEFETTAAFLSQIIETTRESAETAGTALKTVIARFEELKKSPSEIGTVDGEEVDANKIETALRSVGVSLRDSVTGQFRDLDDVFIELSSKWDTLDRNTQRYIATIAAGSRQQSRFIAMMQDYSRTVELVLLAEDASGASDQQFTKTLESLETKLNKLSNSWNTFLMGIANSDIIKLGVDLLNGLVTALNKITNTGNRFIDSLTKIGLVVVTFKLLKKAINATDVAIKTVKSSTDKTASSISQFRKAFDGAWNSKNSKNINLLTKQFAQQATAVEKAKKATEAQGMSTDAAAIANQNLASAEANLTATKEALAKANKSASFNQEIYNQLVSAGVSTDVAATIASNDAAAAQYNSAIAAETSATATGVDTAETAKNTIVETANSVAKRMGFLATLKATVGLFALSSETRKNSVAKLANVIATKAGTAANNAFVISLLSAVPIIAIVVVALGALALAIFLIAKAIKTDKERQAELIKTTAELREQLESANDELDSLKDSKNNIANLTEELDNLTQGTESWRLKLQEVNNEIISLIAKYPELAQFVSTTDSGLLQISTSGWDSILTKQRQAVINLQNASLSATLQLNKTNNNIARDAIKNQSGPAGASFYPYGSMSNKDIENLYYAYSKDNRSATGNKEDIKGFLNEYITKTGATGVNVEWLADDFSEVNADVIAFGQKIDDSATQAKAALQTMSNTIITTSTDLQDTDFSKQLIDTISLTEDEYDTAYAKAASETDKLGQKDRYVAYLRTIGQTGTEAEITKLRKDIKDGEITEDTIKEAINASKLDVALTAALKTANTYLGKLKISTGNSDNFQAFVNSLTLGGGALTIGQLNSSDIQKAVDDDGVDNYLASIGTTVAQLEAAGFTTEDVINGVTTAQENLNNAYTNGAKYTTQTSESIQRLFDSSFKDLTVDQVQAFTNEMKAITLAGGNSTDFMSIISDAVKGLSGDEQTAALNLASTFDFTSRSSIQAFTDKIYELTGKYIPDLTDEIITASGAIQVFSQVALTNLLSTTNDVIDSLKDQESANNKIISKDLYSAISTAVGDESWMQANFATNGSIYYYLGNTITDLLNDIRENTAKTVETDIANIEEQINYGEYFDDIAKSDDKKYTSIMFALSNGNFEELATNGALKRFYYAKTGELPETVATRILSNIGYSEEALNLMTTEGKLKALQEAYNKYYGANGTSYAQNKKSLEASITTSNIQQITSAGNTGKLSNITALESRGEGESGYTSAELLAGSAIKLAQVEIAPSFADAIKSSIETAGATLTQWEANLMAYNAGVWGAAMTTAKTNIEKSLNYWESENAYLQQVGTSQIGTSLENAFNLGANTLSDEWINTNKTIIQRWIDGDETAFTEIEKGIRELLVNQYGNNSIVSKVLQSEGVSSIIDSGGAVAISDTTVYTTEEIDMITEALNKIGISADFTDGKLTSLYQTSAQDIDAINEYTKSLKSNLDAIEKYIPEINYITTLQERRNKLENKYSSIINSQNATLADLISNQQNILDNFTETAKKQSELSVLSANDFTNFSRAASYMGTYWTESNGKINTNWQAITGAAKTMDSESYQKLLDEIDQAKDLIGKVSDTTEDLNDTVESYRNYIENVRSGASDYEQRILDAIVDRRQSDIDSLSDINDTITQANSDLLSSIKENINNVRQDLSNQKKEQEIADKKTRLAYLKMDTSGANHQEILTLQQEIDDSQQDYSDTLVDQKLDALSDENEKAATQRKEQIDILTAQLNQDKSTGVLWSQVYEYLQGGNQSDLISLLQETDGYKAMSSLKQADWIEALKESQANYDIYTNGSWAEMYNQLEALVDKALLYFDNNFQWIMDSVRAEISQELLKLQYEADNGEIKTLELVGDYTNDLNSYITKMYTQYGGTWEKALATGDTLYDDEGLAYLYNVLLQKANTEGYTEDLAKDLTTLSMRLGYEIDYANLYNGGYLTKAYATGGLNTETGIAWLDGTTAKPELVLNAADTANFLALKDILSDILSTGEVGAAPNNSNYEININVDKLTSDYDVDAVANRVKAIITSDAKYRNVNIVNRLK